MISKVNSNTSVQAVNANKQADEIQQDELKSEAANAADKVEISNQAIKVSQGPLSTAQIPTSQRFMEVFTVNFWSRGFSEAFELALAALRFAYPQSEIESPDELSDDDVETILTKHENVEAANRTGEMDEASETESQRRMTAMKISRRIANGDNVPMQDHRFLAEFDPNLYKASLKASMVAENDDPEDYESLVDEMSAAENARANLQSEDSELAAAGEANEASNTIDITVDGVVLPNAIV